MTIIFLKTVNFLALLAAFLTFPCGLMAITIEVRGWINQDFPTDPASFFADPVVGRIACPALAHFNSMQGVSEGLILKTLKQTDPTTWTLEVRSGIFFWSGEEVQGIHIKAYLEDHLHKIIRKKLAPIKSPVNFKVTTTDKYLVRVHWDSAYEVGPFILNEEPFSRPIKGNKFTVPYECAGRFRPDGSAKKSDSYTLIRTPGYGGQTERLVFTNDNKEPQAPFYLNFLWPFDFSHEEAIVEPKKKGCSSVLLPHFTAIAWNNGANKWSQKMRQELSKFISFDELVHSGSAYTGLPVSWPFPYDKVGAPFPKANLKNHALELNKFPPFLLDRKGFSFERAVEETLRTFGLLKVEPVKGNATASLTGFMVDPSGHQLHRLFHSRSKKFVIANAPLSDQLDQALDEYVLASSRDEKGGLNARKKLNVQFHAFLPVTTIVQHAVCVRAKGIQATAGRGDDPDWFRKMIP